jgi:hypothetical protein
MTAPARRTTFFRTKTKTKKTTTVVGIWNAQENGEIDFILYNLVVYYLGFEKLWLGVVPLGCIPFLR